MRAELPFLRMIVVGATTSSSASINIRQQQVDAGGIGLHRQRVAIAVHHQAGQPVGLGMDQAIEGPRIKQIAQGQRLFQTRGDEVAVDRRRGVAGEKARGDQRIWVEHRHAQLLAAGVLDGHQCALGQRLGGGVHLDFVGEYPGVTAARAARLPGDEFDDGAGRGGHARFRSTHTNPGTGAPRSSRVEASSSRATSKPCDSARPRR